MLKYASTGEPIAVSLATHLMRDFYTESNHFFDHILNEFELKPNTQLLTINFEIRAKKYVEETILAQKRLAQQESGMSSA